MIFKRRLQTEYNVPKNVPKKVRQDMIIDVMGKNGSISLSEIAEKFNIAEKTVKRDILKLKEAGRLKRVGHVKGGHWKILEEE